MTYSWSNERGAITVADGALTRIVIQAVESVDGARVLRPRRHVGIDVDAGRAHVELELAVAYGKVLPDVARAVQASVAAALASMCDFAVAGVDVAIEELDA